MRSVHTVQRGWQHGWSLPSQAESGSLQVTCNIFTVATVPCEIQYCMLEGEV